MFICVSALSPKRLAVLLKYKTQKKAKEIKDLGGVVRCSASQRRERVLINIKVVEWDYVYPFRVFV